ncbi:transmembrane protein 6/97 [Kockovaella imperatae]|uniref:Efficient mitochondria targeting-associated protein 19 n=1 Tax=Kockovaella imperatae TaxID=4999 RepID=A0A1Y1ULZ2_9TREE|nr:transmembrane protein 6/97 [Kockovaella imperatae]ORX39019.1 transmembrane protein 6/97 [Kockovaella imperatae]
MSRFAGRSLDRIWFYFFVMHIPISLAVDFQALYPPSWIVNTPLPAFIKWYMGWSRDPVILGALGGSPLWHWMKAFFWLEAVFQLPCWILGAWGMWTNDKRVYPLLLAYGASTATTLLPTLQALFTVPSTPPLSTLELANLLGCYVPYLLIPLGIAMDMSIRLHRIIAHSQARKAI